MASTFASSRQNSFKYDVFLSFRGEDTRKNFVDHLYHALHQRGIITYKDDEKIEKGERINDQLIRSIKDSRFYIIVFSKNYASSSWCLDELVHIIECQETKEQTAFPVFYDVEPTEIRNQSGAVGEAFAKHVEKEAAGRWIDALKKAADLAGWELKTTVDGHEAKFIQKIVKDISLKPHFINSSVDEKLVGMGTRVQNIVSSLEIDSDDIRIIGIKGIGGGGKTTLARAVFDHISHWFEGNSFVENVRQVSKGFGLKEQQKQVLKDVLNDQSIDVTSVYDGKNMMKRMMPGRKALVVLDDVDDIEQLEALAGELTWLKPGSRIIITTRDQQVLVAHGASIVHDVNLLSNEEALCLFSRYAFKKEIPNQGYEELSRKVVHYAAGLPLTIKVLGSHLCGRSDRVWEDAIERLKTIPEDQTLKRLELSYNGLENDQKEIFLDVVCILKGAEKDDAIRILDSCGYYAEVGLSVLEQKSLINISDDDCLRFHDHIEEMGRNIVRRLHPNEPSRHSRLWIKEEIEDILVNESGTEETKCIKLEYSDLHPAVIMNGLRKMKELRSLYVNVGYTKDADGTQYLPDVLRSLRWLEYPYRSLPETFQANNLVNLEMRGSNISTLWEGGEGKVFNKLKFLDLSYSDLRTFDLRLTPHLEELNLEGCADFSELQMPTECPNLRILHLSHSKVSNLNLGLTPHLEELYLEGCFCLQKIHASIGCLKNLVDIQLNHCLNFVYFSVGKEHESASHDFGATFEISAVCIDACPLHPNNTMPRFGFTCIYDDRRSSWSGNFEKLISFGPCVCKNFEYIFATICGLQQLRVLTLIGSVPQDLWRLESLEKLSLCGQMFQHFPDIIFMLKHLKSLKLKFCLALEKLPENIFELECLEVLCIKGSQSLPDIPNNTCKMKSLKRLDLSYCNNIKKLPEELGSLKILKVLKIGDTSIRRLPHSIYQLKGLRIWGSRKQLESYGFRSFQEEVSIYTHVDV